LGELGILLEQCSDEDLYEFTRQIAAHEITENRKDELNVVSQFLEKNFWPTNKRGQTFKV
ncbi:hypothetical protein, partial [Kingella kingae]|uniref:hypothetical protein n=1 Tax=Kingella kingae TaxID=504 RepID=UPI001E2B69A8